MWDNLSLKEVVEYANDPYPSIRKWAKDTGKKIVGSTIADVPEEIVHAFGFLPVALIGTQKPLKKAPAKLPDNACSLARSNLELVMSYEGDLFDGFVLPQVCDTTQHLSDIWRINFPEKYVESFLAPRQADRPSARYWVKEEIERLIASLSNWTGRTIQDKDLLESIKVLNESKTLLAQIYDIKRKNPAAITNKNTAFGQAFCDEIKKRTNGRVEITYYSGGTLLTAPKMAVGVSTGIADISMAHCGYSRGRFPVMEIMELPIGSPIAYIITHVANDFYDKFKPKEWSAYYPLMFSTSPPAVLHTLTKPVRVLEELKSMKIRGTGRIGDLVKALGATPMPIEMVDLYESLRRNVMDGNFEPMEQLKGFKIGELIKYATASWKIGTSYTFYIVMNRSKWDPLPPDKKRSSRKLPTSLKKNGQFNKTK
jgi:TRAP-type C4-dicarboxylate transport system substrate-binding protein